MIKIGESVIQTKKSRRNRRMKRLKASSKWRLTAPSGTNLAISPQKIVRLAIAPSKWHPLIQTNGCIPTCHHTSLLSQVHHKSSSCLGVTCIVWKVCWRWVFHTMRNKTIWIIVCGHVKNGAGYQIHNNQPPTRGGVIKWVVMVQLPGPGFTCQW